VVTPPWSFTGVVNAAWDRSLRGLQAVITVVATLLILTWWIILPLGLGWLGFRLYLRRARPARPARAARRVTPQGVRE